MIDYYTAIHETFVYESIKFEFYTHTIISLYMNTFSTYMLVYMHMKNGWPIKKPSISFTSA